MPDFNLYTILPVIVLALWASVLLAVDIFLLKDRKDLVAAFSALGLLVTLAISVTQSGVETSGFLGMVVLDGFAQYFHILFLLSGLLGIAVSYGYMRRMNIDRGEFYPLMLLSITGMMLMAQAADLVLFFLALELLSIPLYVLSAFAYPKPQSEEAGLKYFFLGSFSTGFVVYGIAMLYGATGSIELSAILAALTAGTANSGLALFGAGLLLVGFGFKVAAVPFHMWTPDVYQGAPSPVTAFMSAGAKAAGFAAMLRIFVLAFPGIAAELTPIVQGLAALTMVVGNVIAVSQLNIKRMLAYSSIAQAGYILMAFVPFADAQVTPVSVAAALFYLLAYVLASFGAWAVVISMEKNDGKGLEIADYAGLGRANPAMAAAMTVFMLSLIGLPPTLGLVGKFYLFRAVIEAGYYNLAVVGVITSLISAFYYLRVVVTMYMKDGQPKPLRDRWLTFTWVFAALVTVMLSLMPGWLFEWASRAVLRLF